MRSNSGRLNGSSTRKKWVRWLKRAFWASLGVLLLGVISLTLVLWSVFNGCSDRIAQLPLIQASLQRPPTEILSADGVVLCRLAAEHREPVSYPDIPKLVIDATVAAEDRRFFEHMGVDFTAMLRALWVNIRSGSIRQGGSTITQQVAKRLLTSGDRSWRRKLEDACLAVQIERELTKEQIITLYLNQVYYGSQAYGIKAAADVYFAKDLDELSIAEVATLARLPRRPSDENPFVDLDAAKRNRDIVLAIMLEEGMIQQNDYEKALREPLKLAAQKPVQQTGIRFAPYFTTWILEQLRSELPDEDWARGGYRIYTTLNMKAQKFAEQAVAKTLDANRRRRVTEGAIVVATLNGEVLAMVGGSDFKRSQYNVITQGRRQPGSAFKPFVYAAAIEMGIIKPNSSVSNARFVYRDPYSGKVWSPKGGGGGGSVSVQTALTASINTPAVWVCQMVGPSNVANFAKQHFGIRSKLDPVLPLALGSSAVNPLEMAEAYSVFGTRGNRSKMYGIRRIVGPDGTTVREYAPVITSNVLSASTAEPMADILRRTVLSGTGRRAASVLNAAGKTGTTSEHKDAWFCGFTDQLVAIAWVANATYDPNRTPAWRYGQMAGVFGGEVAAKMWADAVGPIQKIMGEKDTGRRPKSFGGGEKVKPELEPDQTPSEPVDDLPMPDPGPDFEPGNPPPDTPSGPPPNGDPIRSSASHQASSFVEICVESGQRATTYCKVRRRQAFAAGQEPSGACTLHRP